MLPSTPRRADGDTVAAVPCTTSGEILRYKARATRRPDSDRITSSRGAGEG
jgi:hypothetical protein